MLVFLVKMLSSKDVSLNVPGICTNAISFIQWCPFLEKLAGSQKLSGGWKIWRANVRSRSRARFRHHCIVIHKCDCLSGNFKLARACFRLLQHICWLIFLSLRIRLTSSTLFSPPAHLLFKECKPAFSVWNIAGASSKLFIDTNKMSLNRPKEVPVLPFTQPNLVYVSNKSSVVIFKIRVTVCISVVRTTK